MGLSHREEEIVKIVTPLALEAVEQQAHNDGRELTNREKAMAVAETMNDLLDRELSDVQLNLPCDGPYCSICGLCSM